MRFLAPIKLSSPLKVLLVAGICAALGYWWVSGYVWFRINDTKISINGRPKGIDYSCFQSLKRDIFCYHQDHGTQYFISPSRNEVSTIDEEVNASNFEAFLISSGARDGFENSALKTKLPNSPVLIGREFLEFQPSVAEWKSGEVERWRISY